jgi:hypothetical protein
VTARLALFGVATIAAGPGPVVVVCGGADAGPDEVRAAVEQARTAGTFLAVTADEVLASDLDVLAFGGQVLAALGVA